MSPSLPSGKFDATPIETTRHSSESNDTPPKPRRFVPQPIETTTSSSKTSRKHAHSADSDASEKQQPPPPPPPSRRFVPEIVEHSSSHSTNGNVSHRKDPGNPQPRRFVPEVVEHTSSHNNKSNRPDNGEGKKSAPRFTPEMVESTRASTKDRQSSGHTNLRFAPVVLETTFHSHRKTSGRSDHSDKDTPPRKFKPILVDTASRSRRADKSAANPWKTEEGFQLHAKEHRQHITGTKTPHVTSSEDLRGLRNPATSVGERVQASLDLSRSDLSVEPKRQLAPLDGSAPLRPSSLSSQRRPTFRCPDLDTIESSESSAPQTSSSSSSRASSPGHNSPVTTSDSSFNFYSDATRRRESIEPEIAQYLLELQAKKQKQRLEQEALYAAFPTETVHEKVHHYINDDEDSDTMSIEERPVTFDPEEDFYLAVRRESTTKISWERLEMQRHAEALQQERNANRITSKKQTESPWWAPPGPEGSGSSPPGARPPLLGDDLVFPRCPSPEPARFDVTQGSKTIREQMREQSQHAVAQESTSPGLWQASAGPSKPIISVQTPHSSNKSSPTTGLWGGFCVASNDNEEPPRNGLTGLMTPYPEPAGNPFEQAFAAPPSSQPEAIHMRTPLTGGGALARVDLAHLDGVLNSHAELDRRVEEEFPESFVTQVYNYLSLGYPSLARPFDEELSKISKIPIAELRADDQLAKDSPRGYIRLGSDFEGGGGEGPTEQSCARWKALKLYIREWARQEEEGMIASSDLASVGIGVRRGSWAH